MFLKPSVPPKASMNSESGCAGAPTPRQSDEAIKKLLGIDRNSIGNVDDFDIASVTVSDEYRVQKWIATIAEEKRSDLLGLGVLCRVMFSCSEFPKSARDAMFALEKLDHKVSTVFSFSWIHMPGEGRFTGFGLYTLAVTHPPLAREISRSLLELNMKSAAPDEGTMIYCFETLCEIDPRLASEFAERLGDTKLRCLNTIICSKEGTYQSAPSSQDMPLDPRLLEICRLALAAQNAPNTQTRDQLVAEIESIDRDIYVCLLMSLTDQRDPETQMFGLSHLQASAPEIARHVARAMVGDSHPQVSSLARSLITV